MSSTIESPRIEPTPSQPVTLPAPVAPDPQQEPPRIVIGEVVAATDDYQPPPLLPRRWRLRAVVVVLAVVSLLVGAAGGMMVSPLLFATATITLTPESHALTGTAAIPLTVRLYPGTREILTRTIAATGTATRPATAARGSITFYNGLPARQTISSGTLLTSTSGVPVLTEEDAYIPAATPPTEGSTTVAARAENTGPAGNIAAATMGGPCCRAYVLAYNGAFWGGADARTYRTPTASDIADALDPLRSQLDSRVQGEIHTWLRPGDGLLPPKCEVITSSSAQPGTEADHVTVTVGETCTAAAYRESDLQQTATAWLSGVAARQFGPVYRPTTAVRAEVSASTLTGDRATLRLQLSGRYSYSFSQQEVSHLRTQLAGVSVGRARVMLRGVEGVTEAQIQSSTTTLPSDPSRIQILLSQ